jgi:hypothetical protein
MDMGFVYTLIAIAVYGIISLGVYFVCSWFSKKEYDDWDMLAAFAAFWILFPLYYAIRLLMNMFVFFGKGIDRLKNRMLEYKALRIRRGLERKEGRHIIDEQGGTGHHVNMTMRFVEKDLVCTNGETLKQVNVEYVSSPQKDPLLVEAEQEVEQLLNEGKL